MVQGSVWGIRTGTPAVLIVVNVIANSGCGIAVPHRMPESGQEGKERAGVEEQAETAADPIVAEAGHRSRREHTQKQGKSTRSMRPEFQPGRWPGTAFIVEARVAQGAKVHAIPASPRKESWDAVGTDSAINFQALEGAFCGFIQNHIFVPSSRLWYGMPRFEHERHERVMTGLELRFWRGINTNQFSVQPCQYRRAALTWAPLGTDKKDRVERDQELQITDMVAEASGHVDCRQISISGDSLNSNHVRGSPSSELWLPPQTSVYGGHDVDYAMHRNAYQRTL
ncbi:hypothetical protein DFH06DRAFT_1148070 [Mycena polygramma]|nr:hypothetical protein DFH06DRAFT_1148070 [Mycena polygramma]